MDLDVYIKKPQWIEYISGGDIVDCGVRDRDIIYIGIRKKVDADEASMMWDSEIPSQLCAIYLDDPMDSIADMTVKGFSNPRLGIALLPKPCGMLVSRNFPNSVMLMGKDVEEMEVVDSDSMTIVGRVKTLFGYAYTVGEDREIYKRVGAGQWEKLSGLPEEDDIDDVGFEDFDAFAENDMYAVGGNGDLWHFDGNSWSQKGFPSNIALATVTCAGDGNVYITGEGGNIWVGRDSTWKLVYEGKSTIPWNDAIWFNGQLWLSSDYRLRIWDGSNLIPPKDADGDDVLMSGHMDARDGILAIASTDTVMTFDGKEWRVIVAPYD